MVKVVLPTPTILCKSNANRERETRDFNDLSTNFQGMYFFEQLKLSSTYSFMVLMQFEISGGN